MSVNNFPSMIFPSLADSWLSRLSLFSGTWSWWQFGSCGFTFQIPCREGFVLWLPSLLTVLSCAMPVLQCLPHDTLALPKVTSQWEISTWQWRHWLKCILGVPPEWDQVNQQRCTFGACLNSVFLPALCGWKSDQKHFIMKATLHRSREKISHQLDAILACALILFRFLASQKA